MVVEAYSYYMSPQHAAEIVVGEPASLVGVEDFGPLPA
jgi:hypothetical protein